MILIYLKLLCYFIHLVIYLRQLIYVYLPNYFHSIPIGNFLWLLCYIRSFTYQNFIKLWDYIYYFLDIRQEQFHHCLVEAVIIYGLFTVLNFHLISCFINYFDLHEVSLKLNYLINELIHQKDWKAFIMNLIKIKILLF